MLEKENRIESTKSQAAAKRSSRRITKTPSHREESIDDSLEEENEPASAPKITSNKKVTKKLKVILPKVVSAERKPTFAKCSNFSSMSTIERELERVMQPSSFQLLPKQTLEEDSASGYTGKE